MSEFWKRRKKVVLIAAAAVATCSVVAGAVWFAMFFERTGDASPAVTSAWPVADSERVVPKPPEPLRWPLTGIEVAPGESPTAVRVLAVKIENSPAARPQTGLDAADVVYETLTEGGISRFNALFHSRVPEEIGPVRSARMSDVRLVPQYSALLAHSGANSGILSAIRSAGLEVVDHAGAGAAYRRASDRRAPHNLYLDPARVREIALEKGYSGTQELKGLQFSPSVESTIAVSQVTVPFSRANSVVWEYDPEANLYLRANNGRPHVDRTSGERLSATNVVVLWARSSATGPRGIGGATLEIELVGEGRMALFRDGVRVDGTWATDGEAPPVFKDQTGEIVRLRPGVTWFQVVPLDINISMR